MLPSPVAAKFPTEELLLGILSAADENNDARRKLRHDLHIQETAVQAKDQELQTKDQELQAKDQALQTKDQALQAKNQALHIKDMVIQVGLNSLLYFSHTCRFFMFQTADLYGLCWYSLSWVFTTL